MTQPFVVVGAGLAAAKAMEQLREDGFAGPVVVYGDETHLPYERPPLSKGYLMGEATRADATVHDQHWYDDQGVELRLGVTVTAVDRGSRTLVTSAGRQTYDQLLLATGAEPRRLPMADGSGAAVRYLRTLDDSDRLRESLQPGRRVAIVGGGWIGLEVAAASRSAGCEVTVLESLELPLLRVLGQEVAQRFAALHRAHGVDLRTAVGITAVEQVGGPDSGTALLRLDDGEPVECDLVVVGIGVTPRTQLAEAAGLEVDNGIVVDEHLCTSDPAVLAAGDVANAYHPRLERHLRVEHWDNAIAQGRAAARSMLGDRTPYERLPYFFTDQYDLGMEYVGSVGPDGYDHVVVRGQPDDETFTAFWVRGDRVLAGMHANDWDAIEPVRRIVEDGRVSERLLDVEVALTDV